MPPGVPGVWVRTSSLMPTELSWKEVPFLIVLLKVELFFIPKTSDIDDNGRIIRSPDALRPLTLQLRLQTSFFCHLTQFSDGSNLLSAFTLTISLLHHSLFVFLMTALAATFRSVVSYFGLILNSFGELRRVP